MIVVGNYSCCRKVREFAEIEHALPNAETHGVNSLESPTRNGRS